MEQLLEGIPKPGIHIIKFVQFVCQVKTVKVTYTFCQVLRAF